MSTNIADETPFRPYTEIPALLPKAFWITARLGTLAVTLWIVWLLYARPELGVTVFWQLFIPSLPLVFAIVPGLWRQVCPMAFLNQLPVQFGWTAGRTLPLSLKESSYLYATLMFIGLVGLKHVTLYTSSAPLIGLLVASLGLAFLGGLVFKGRSGWCGTFCPLGPLQKVYGHVPPVLVKNGYCEPCVGCQKNCYDFSPRSAFYADLYDKDPWYAGHRRFFVAILPGLILSFWLGRDPTVIGYGTYLRELLIWLLLSAGIFFMLTTVLRTSVYKIAAVYGVLAIFLYYWFAAPVMVGAVRELFAIPLPDAVGYALQLTVVGVAARNLLAGFRTEKAYHAEKGQPEPHLGADLGALATAMPEGGSGEVVERASGKRFAADPNRTLLELLEGAGVKMDFGCRTGMCGADPVVIEAGAEHLNEPSQVELETLRRLGIEGRARMACVCRALDGPVAINVKADPSTAPEPEFAQPREDMAAKAGIERVVIIGNGVAGITAADRIRRASPSCEIDVVTRENHHFYNRMAIGRAIYGRTAMDGLALLPPDWHKQQNVNVWLNTIARDIDRDAKVVHLGTGQDLAYDKLVLATGGAAWVPDIPGTGLAGCFVLREAQDALAIRAWCQEQTGRDAVVVGGGVLGIEAADALHRLGMNVTIIQRGPRLMERNLDEKGARVLESYLTGLGFKVYTDAEIVSVEGEGRVSAVRLADGTEIDSQICLFCIGVKGNTALARAAGLDVGGGVLVNGAMQTSDPEIYAIGDVAEFEGTLAGLWTLSTQHAQLATNHMLELQEGSSVPRPTVQLKMDGIDVVSFGLHEASMLGQEVIVDADEAENTRRKLIVENGRIFGAVFVGPPGTAMGVAELISGETDITPILPDLRRGEWGVLARDPSRLSVPATLEQDDQAGTDAADHAGAAALASSERGDAGNGSALRWAAAILIGVVIAGLGVYVLGMRPDESRMAAIKQNMMAAFEPKLTRLKLFADEKPVFGPAVVGGVADGADEEEVAAEAAGTAAEPSTIQTEPEPDAAADPDVASQPVASGETDAATEFDATAEPDAAAEPDGTEDRDAAAQEPAANEPDAGEATGDARRDAAPVSEGGDAATQSDGAPDDTDARGATDVAQEPDTDARAAADAAQEPAADTGAQDVSSPVTKGDDADDAGSAGQGVEAADAEQPAEPAFAFLAGEALQAEAAGARIRGGADFGGQPFVARLDARGNVTADITSQDSFGSSMMDRGRWEVRDNLLCMQFNFFGGGRVRCMQVAKRGSEYRLHTRDGAVIRWVMEK